VISSYVSGYEMSGTLSHDSIGLMTCYFDLSMSFQSFTSSQRATYRTVFQVDECLSDRLDRIDLSEFIDRKLALLVELN